MVPRWFRSTTALILIPILLLLLGAVACGSAAEPDTAPPADTPPKDTMTDTKKDTMTDTKKDTMTDTKKDTMTDTKKDVPVAKMDPTAMPAATGEKLQRLVVAVAPMGWDTNFTYRVSTTGLLDKRPVQEHLIGIDRVDGSYEPQLAEKWEVAPNGKDWTFTLRKGVMWHSEPEKPEGWGEFTSRDVRHTAYMHTEPNSNASNGTVWRGITGVTKADQKADNGQELVTAKIDEAVEIIDDYTVVIHSADVLPELYYFHSVNRGFPIVSKARYDALGDDDIGRAIVGTGPLKFVEREEASHVRYEAVPGHWRMTPSYNELEFRWTAESATRVANLVTGNAHMADIERALQGQVKEKGMRVIRSKFPGMLVKYSMYGNYPTVPEFFDPDLPFANLKVRKGIQKAIDSKGIAKSLLPGTEIEYPALYGFHPVLDEEMWPGIMNPKWFAEWEEEYGYDPDAARALLKEAGYENGFEISIHLHTLSGLPEIVEIGQAIAGNLEDVGITVKLEQIDYPQSRGMSRKHNTAGVLRPSRSSHRAVYLSSAYSTRLSSSHPYTSVEMDAVIGELEQTVGLAERTKLLQQIGDITFYDHARLMLFGLYVEMAVNPEYVSNYDFPATMSGYFTHLEYVETVPQ
jgi:ABC-type transport system substrate-binding protein